MVASGLAHCRHKGAWFGISTGRLPGGRTGGAIWAVTRRPVAMERVLCGWTCFN